MGHGPLLSPKACKHLSGRPHSCLEPRRRVCQESLLSAFLWAVRWAEDHSWLPEGPQICHMASVGSSQQACLLLSSGRRTSDSSPSIKAPLSRLGPPGQSPLGLNNPFMTVRSRLPQVPPGACTPGAGLWGAPENPADHGGRRGKRREEKGDKDSPRERSRAWGCSSL